MKVPAKLDFSSKYNPGGRFGALGLLDRGRLKVLDMVQMRTRRDFGGGRDRR